jgi:hypothetical protein
MVGVFSEGVSGARKTKTAGAAGGCLGWGALFSFTRLPLHPPGGARTKSKRNKTKREAWQEM